MRDFFADFNFFADVQIEAATLSNEVKAIRDQIMSWAGTKAKVYAMWLYKHSKAGEPLEDIIPIAKFHAENSNRLRGREADINSFKNPGELQKFLEEKFSPKEDESPEMKPDAVVDGWQLHFPQSAEESCAAAGHGTSWCTARRSGENLFYNYVFRGINLVYATSPDGKKYSLGYRDGELIEGDPEQGGAGYGGVTVDSGNNGINPKKVIPPKVLEKANFLGSQNNKVKINIREKLQTPEGIQKLIGDKRYDAARNLIFSIRQSMPEELSGKEDYIGNLLHEKFLKGIKNFNIQDLYSSKFKDPEKDLLDRITSTIVNDSNNEDNFFDIHSSGEKGISPMEYFYHFPKLTQLHLFGSLRHYIDRYDLSVIPKDRIEKSKSNFNLLNHFQNLTKSNFGNELEKEIISNPKKNLSHKLSAKDLNLIFNINADYKSSKEMLDVVKDKCEPDNFVDTLRDALSNRSLKLNSKALIEDLPYVLSKISKETSLGFFDSKMDDINFYLSKKALENTDVNFKDVNALWDISSELIKSPEDDDRTNNVLSTNFKNNILKTLLINIDLEKVTPKNQDELIDVRFSERYVDYRPKGYLLYAPGKPLNNKYIDENNPYEDEHGNQWVEPYDPYSLDDRTFTQKRLQKQKLYDLIDPEIRQKIKERQNKDREDTLYKDRLKTNQNTEFYEEEWLDDKFIASFNKFAEFLIEGSEKKVDFLVNQYPKAEKIIRWLASKDPSGQRYKYLNEMWDAARAGAKILEIPLKLRYRLEIEKLKNHPIAKDLGDLKIDDTSIGTLKNQYIQLSRSVRTYNKNFNTLKENFGSGRTKEIVSQIGHNNFLYLSNESLDKLLSVKDSDKVIQDIAIRSIKKNDDRSVEEIIQESKSREENAKIRDHGDGLVEYLNYDAAAFYRGLDTEWCWAYITDDSMWESYSQRGRLFSLDFNGELIGVFLSNEGNLEEIRDAKDDLLTGQKLQNVVEILKTKLPVQNVSARSTGPVNENTELGYDFYGYEGLIRQYELHGAEGEFLRFIKELPNSYLYYPLQIFLFSQEEIENSVNDIDKFYNLMIHKRHILYSFTSDKVRDSIIREFLTGRSLEEVIEEEKMKRFIPDFGDEEKKVLNSKAYKKLNNIFKIEYVINLVQRKSADEIIKVLSYIENHYRKGNLLNYDSQKVYDLIFSMLNFEPKTVSIETNKPIIPSSIEEHSEKTYKMYNDSLDDDKTMQLYDPDIALEKDEYDINNDSYDDSYDEYDDIDDNYYNEYIASLEEFTDESTKHYSGRFLGSFKKEARTLWHGTSLTSAQSIMKEGLIPSIGQWTESSYGGNKGWGTGGLLDTSFAADKEELSRAMGGIAAQVAGILDKDFYEVTDEEFIEYGALIKITEGDKEMEHYRPSGEYTQNFPQSQSEPTIRVRQDNNYDPESDEYPDLFDDDEDEIVQEELKPNAPAVSRHVEPGDWFTREEIPPERLSVLTGNKMIDVFRRAGLWPRMWGPSREDNVSKQWVAWQMRNHYDEWVDHLEEAYEEDGLEEEVTRQDVANYLMDYSSNFDLEELRKQIPTSLGLFERGKDYAYGDDIPDEGMEDDFINDSNIVSPNHYRRKRHREAYIEGFEYFADTVIESLET